MSAPVIRTTPLAAAALALLLIGAVSADLDPAQADALEVIYTKTSGGTWLNPWVLGTDPCNMPDNWPGVSCNKDGNAVLTLELAGQGLKGTLEAGDLSVFAALERFNVAVNEELRFELMDLADLPKLSHVDLSGVNLSRYSGEAWPETWFYSPMALTLKVLKLTGCSLTGTMQPGFAELNHLQVLNVAHNQFEGHLPANFGSDGAPSLVELTAHDCLLSGDIPDMRGKPIARLNVEGNQYHGPIPAWVTNHAEWEGELEPRLGGNRWTCPIPAEGTNPLPDDLVCGCEAGLRGGKDMIVECKPCDAGSFNDDWKPWEEGQECTLCPSGVYQDEAGASECKECPDGQVAKAEGAIACARPGKLLLRIVVVFALLAGGVYGALVCVQRRNSGGHQRLGDGDGSPSDFSSAFFQKFTPHPDSL